MHSVQNQFTVLRALNTNLFAVVIKGRNASTNNVHRGCLICCTMPTRQNRASHC